MGLRGVCVTIADRFAGCVEQLRTLYVPPTAEESAEFERLKAREMARAEAKRKPSPQMEIPGA